MNPRISIFVLKAIICLLVFILFSFCAKAQKAVSVNYSVYFKSDKFDLDNPSTQRLDSFIRQLKKSLDYNVYLEANTDADGSNNYNDMLSRNRATSVEYYLTKNGIVVSKIKAKANGEEKPLFSNSTDEGKAGNRRVDLRTTIFYFNSVNEVLETIEKRNEQKFELKNGINEIKAKDGTTINVNANELTMPDGSSAKDKIELLLKEAISPADIVSSNLSTTSNGKILQTGGMLYVEVSSGGKKMKLKNGAKMKVSIPAKKLEPGMQLFVGEKTASGKINWRPTGQTSQPKKLNVDFTKIKKIRMNEEIVNPINSYASALNEPAKPSAPKTPKGLKPYRQLKYEPNFFEKLFAMHKRIERKEEALNEPYKKNYDAKIANQEKSIDKYETEMRSYLERKLPAYKADSIAFYTKLSSRISELKNYIAQRMRSSVAKRLNENLNNMFNQPIYSNTQLRFYSSNQFDVSDEEIKNLIVKNIGLQNIDLKRTANCTIKQDNFFFRSDGYWATRVLTFKNGDSIIYNIQIVCNKYYNKMVDSLGVKNYVKECNQLIAQEALKEKNLGGIDNYVFTVSDMQWINCDRFYDNQAPLVDVKIKENDEGVKYYIVCNDINSFITAEQIDQSVYQANSIPQNTNITIVGVKLKNGKLQMASMKTKAGSKAAYQLTFFDTSLKQVSEELKKLNSSNS